MLVWETKKFQEISKEELYEILCIRGKIFVVEQNCVYNDLDNKDFLATHLTGREKGKLVAYARVFKPGDYYEKHSSIGRILVVEEKRNLKIGRQAVEESVFFCKKNFPEEPIKISAQAHLKKFYQQCGFIDKGESYLEDGIPHRAMYYEG